MTAYTCGGCGEEFTDERDTDVAYQDTTRCPCCGQKAAVTDAHETTATSTDVADASDLSVNVEISFGGEGAQATVSADGADGGDP